MSVEKDLWDRIRRMERRIRFLEANAEGGGAGGGDVATDDIWDAKGDLAAGTGANTAARVAVGANGKVLTAASGEAPGIKWEDAPGGAPTDATYVTGAAEGGLSAELVLGAAVIMKGTTAAIPAASIAGRVYVENDLLKRVFRDTGAAWEEVGRYSDGVYIPRTLVTEQGDIIYASAVSTPAALAHGNAGNFLQSGGHAANPSWVDHVGGADPHTQYQKEADWTTKGDLMGATGAGATARLAVGDNAKVLTANSATATGLQWASPAAPGAHAASHEVGGADVMDGNIAPNDITPSGNIAMSSPGSYIDGSEYLKARYYQDTTAAGAVSTATETTLLAVGPDIPHNCSFLILFNCNATLSAVSKYTRFRLKVTEYTSGTTICLADTYMQNHANDSGYRKHVGFNYIFATQDGDDGPYSIFVTTQNNDSAYTFTPYDTVLTVLVLGPSG